MLNPTRRNISGALLIILTYFVPRLGLDWEAW
jgi:hypothetical protein